MTRDLLLVIISLSIWGVGEGAFFYFQPLYLEELGASPVAIGTILGSAGLVMTVVHIPAGYLADRIGRRKLIWAGWFSGAISIGIMAASTSLTAFTIGIILYSLTIFVISPLNNFVTAARNNLTVEKALTTTSAAYNFGAIIGPLVAGLIAERYGLRAIYIFAFGIVLISNMIILFIKSQPTEQNHGSPAYDLMHNKQFMLFLPLCFLIFFALFFPQPLAPNYLKNINELSLQSIGILGSITSLGNVLLNLLFGALPTQTGLFLGQLFVGVFAFLVWRTTQMPVLVLAYFLLGGYKATRTLLLSQVGKIVEKANIGLAYGIVETVAGLSLAAAPPLAGILYNRNPSSIFSTTLLLLIPSLLFTYLRRKLKWNI